MRIAFLNRGRDAFPGGDVIQLDSTMDALRRRGHVADEVGWVAEKLVDYDVCHMMHCNFSWSLGNYNAIKKANKPYVLTPVYYPGPLLSGIEKTDLGEIVYGAKAILPFSSRELEEIRTDLGGLDCCYVIPNGTDPMFHCAPSGVRSGIIAVSARGDSDKNIPLLRKICESDSLNLQVATDWSRQKLANDLRYYKVFVNASGSERMSLTIGEALCAGCRVLATNQNWGNSHYPGLVTFDPNDEIHLEHMIRFALTSPDWDYRPNAAARCLTWDFVAEKLEGVYREVLAV